MSEPKLLTEIEALKLENFFLEAEIVERDLNIATQQSAIYELQKNIREYQIADLCREKSSITPHQKTLKEKKANIASQREVVVNAIKDRLGIDGPFGFNPDTLEVKIDDDKGENHE